MRRVQEFLGEIKSGNSTKEQQTNEGRKKEMEKLAKANQTRM